MSCVTFFTILCVTSNILISRLLNIAQVWWVLRGWAGRYYWYAAWSSWWSALSCWAFPSLSLIKPLRESQQQVKCLCLNIWFYITIKITFHSIRSLIIAAADHDHITGVGECIAASESCYSCVASEMCGVCSNLAGELMCVSTNATDLISSTCQGTWWTTDFL